MQILGNVCADADGDMEDVLLPNCRAPGPFVPDLSTPCDVDAVCGWCSRNQLSFDFLCCESGTYIGPHMTNPMLFYLFWNSVPWTVILMFAFELTEVLLLTMLGSFELLFSDQTDLETQSSSLIGDVLLQGGLGLLVGYLLRVIFVVPTLVSSAARANAFSPGCGRRVVYVVLLYGPVLLSYALIGWTTDAGFRIGLVLHTVVHVAFIWIVIPLVIGSRQPTDDNMVWRQLDGTVFGGLRKTLFFAVWGFIVLLSHSVHFARNQPSFAANEWFQQWLVMWPTAALLLIGAIVVSARRRDYYTVLILFAVVGLIGWLALWSAYALGSDGSTAFIWLGVASLAVAIGLFLAATRPWHVMGIVRDGTAVPGDTNTRLPAVALTRLTADTPVVTAKETERVAIAAAVPENVRPIPASSTLRNRARMQYNV